MTRSITLTLDIADDGQVTVRQTAAGLAAEPPTPPTAAAGPPFDANYADRTGYDEAFLNTAALPVTTPLPIMGAGVAAAAQPLLADPDAHELKYDGYSVVMHAARRLAIYTAANIDGAHRFALTRPADKWRFDPRIPNAAQIDAFYYKNNKFDRGHLTRREDMEYGATPKAALGKAADTLHWTNCTPQHSGFNQSKQLWQGLERHILEDSVEANVFAAQVFTGPVLADDDPVWDKFPDIQYPNRFWKVAAAVTSGGRLFAAGFILDQSGVIADGGIGVAVDIPFGAFKTFQVPIIEIEALTGLTFPCVEPGGAAFLRDVDPLNGAAGRLRAASARALVRGIEAAEAADSAPEGYILLENAASIVRS